MRFKTFLATSVIGLFAVMVFGLIWFFFLGPSIPVGIGWYAFSFAAGLSMIVLPCTLPLAFVIVPLSMGKGPAKGFGLALAFGAGVVLMLSIYGIIAAKVGEVAIGGLGAPLEMVKNWMYFAAGSFAFLFALGEIGLLRVRMPSYTGAAPAFIQRQQDFLKAFLLGVFLGNIGVGCPHPATPLLLVEIATVGDVFYGWLLFFVHAIGRVLPLLLLALLGVLGVNALSWLVARKDKIEKATGWGMVFIAGFILVLGLFSHDWWVASGQHTLIEEITQEERFLNIVSENMGVEPAHIHGSEELAGKTGLFGLPLWLGSWVLVALWLIPMWWYTLKKKQVLKRLWLLILLSALLVGIFVFYLPARFQSAQAVGEDHPHIEEVEEGHHFNFLNLFIGEAFANGDVPDDGHDDHDGDSTEQRKQLIPFVSPKWWLYLIVSVGAMSILSFGMHRYIKGKHE